MRPGVLSCRLIEVDESDLIRGHRTIPAQIVFADYDAGIVVEGPSVEADDIC